MFKRALSSRAEMAHDPLIPIAMGGLTKHRFVNGQQRSLTTSQ
jgi:hypothetical protein